MLYLIDTRNGNQQIVLNHEKTAYYSDQWLETVNYSMEWFGEVLFQKQIVVMTYAKFGVLAERYPRFGFDFEVILCDEIHSLPKFCGFGGKKGENCHIKAQRHLEKVVNEGKVTVIGLSATPDRAEEKLYCPIRKITVDEDVRQLETKQTIPYTNKLQLLEQLSPKDKGIVFIERVTGMIEFQKAAEARGFRTICVWSINQKTHPMNEEQRKVRDYIITNEALPPDYDMFIVNASSETGINIYGQVDYIVVHNTMPETQIQVRGRFRGDLEKLYLLDYLSIQVPEEYMDRELSAEEREALCRIIAIRNENGRIVKWTTVRRLLIEAGYSVVESRKNSKRYYTITL